MSTSFDIHEIADRMRRRSAGEFDALDGVWADDETVSTVNYMPDDAMRCAGREREARGRAEAETFAGLRGVTSESIFHVSEATSTIIETTRLVGDLGGKQMVIPSCIVYTVEDGRLRQLDFYGDSAQGAALVEALTGGGFETQVKA